LTETHRYDRFRRNSHASAQVINGCIKGNGTLKIVADSSGFTLRETPISWLGK